METDFRTGILFCFGKGYAFGDLTICGIGCMIIAVHFLHKGEIIW